MEAPDLAAVSEAVHELLGNMLPGMTTGWSMVAEYMDTDAEPAVSFLTAPGQRLGTGVGHAAMLRLQTDAEFREWYGDGLGYDDDD